MNQHKPSQAYRIATLLDDYQPHCSNEMRQMSIADPPRRINDLEEEGYIIKKEYCRMHTYHDGLPKMYTLISRPPQTQQNAPGATKPGPIDSCDKPKPVREPRGGWSYYPPEPPKACCPIFKASQGRMHAQGCETQKKAA